MTDRPGASEWIARLSAIAEAPTAADTLERLLDAAADAVPRAALFLVRGRRLRGWRYRGYGEDCRPRFERLDLDPARGWLATLLDPAAPLIVERGFGDRDPDFGQIAAEEGMATAVRVGAVPIALIVGERSLGETPWDTARLGTLGIVGRLRLELDLARRRVAPAAAGAAPPAEAPPRLAEDDAPAHPILPPLPESGLIPFEEGDAPRPTSARDREARRFARLVASDIRLYNEEAVLVGRARGDLAARLESALERGRESFLRRFPDLGGGGLAILEEAYVDVLAAGDSRLLGTPASSPEP